MANTPIRFNAQEVIGSAFELVGVFQAGEAVPTADASRALKRLNRMVSGWATYPLTMPFTNREVFSVVANQSTYTMGPGGEFDTTRPSDIVGAGLLLNSSSPPVEISRGLLTDDAYEAIQIKDLTANQWTSVYFNPTYSGGLASVFLWPTPTTADNDCVLYRGDLIQGFADLTTEYDFPPGYADALEYGLAERLLTPYAVIDPQIRSDVIGGAKRYLGMLKAQNVRLTDLAIDPGLTSDRRGGYNINTGTGGY